MLSPAAFREIISGRRRGFVAAVVRGLLSIVEIPYSIVVGIRNRRFDRDATRVHRVAVPVISVGNLTLGGTGKTPVVAWLARWFRERDVRVCIVSRGYGAKDGQLNDEARELESRLPDVPHLQNPDRVAAATVAIEELETQLIILDDGFQHRRIHRDLNILLVDATEPFGFDHVFPRGTLREPLTGAVRADIVAITKCEHTAADRLVEIESHYQQLAPRATFVRMEQRPKRLLSSSGAERPLSELFGRRTAVFCAIGNPSAFRSTLDDCGCEVVAFREFPDHHDFDRSDIESILRWADEARPELLICTHKDLVKINVDRLGEYPLYALAIDVDVIDGLAELESRLQQISLL